MTSLILDIELLFFFCLEAVVRYFLLGDFEFDMSSLLGVLYDGLRGDWLVELIVEFYFLWVLLYLYGEVGDPNPELVSLTSIDEFTNLSPLFTLLFI